MCVSACIFEFVLVVTMLAGNQGTSEFRYVARQFFAFLCFPLFFVIMKTGLTEGGSLQGLCVSLYSSDTVIQFARLDTEAIPINVNSLRGIGWGIAPKSDVRADTDRSQILDHHCTVCSAP